MLISYGWLREFVDTHLSPDELRERLTMVGLAIDAVERHNSDAVLDVEVPSNRPDCLSHVGIAREVGVIARTPVNLPEIKRFKTEGRAADLTSVEIKDVDLSAICGAARARREDWAVARVAGEAPRNDWPTSDQ